MPTRRSTASRGRERPARVPANLASSATKSIRAQTIWTRLRNILDPSGSRIIRPTDPVGKHIRGGPGAVRAFANVLNTSPPFKRDGLALVPGDMAGVQTIGDIGAKIVGWYQSNGWDITI